LTCVGGYTNEPITISLVRRGAYKPCKLIIRYESIASVNANIYVAVYEGTDYGVYYYKSADSVHDIYVQKAEPYDRCSITEFKSPYNIRLDAQNGTVATPPEGSVRFTRALSDYVKNGTITNNNWNAYVTTGVWNVVNWSGSNGPIAGEYAAYKWGQLVVDDYSGIITQTYYPHLSNCPYFRVYLDGTWSGWKTSAPTNYGTVNSSTNWNDLTSTGKYRVTAVNGANGPSTAYSLGVLLVDYAADDYIQQTYYPTYGNGTPVCRQRRSGTWGGWYGSISGGTGMSLNTQVHYQSVTAARTDANAIYLCY